jgi:predicted secreted protein
MRDTKGKLYRLSSGFSWSHNSVVEMGDEPETWRREMHELVDKERENNDVGTGRRGKIRAWFSRSIL